MLFRQRWILPSLCALYGFVLVAASAQADGVGTLEPLERFRECDRCPEMIVMPPGAFMSLAVFVAVKNYLDHRRKLVRKHGKRSSRPSLARHTVE